MYVYLFTNSHYYQLISLLVLLFLFLATRGGGGGGGERGGRSKAESSEVHAAEVVAVGLAAAGAGKISKKVSSIFIFSRDFSSKLTFEGFCQQQHEEIPRCEGVWRADHQFNA